MKSCILASALVIAACACGCIPNEANAQTVSEWPIIQVYLQGNNFMVKGAPNIKEGTDIPFMLETLNSTGAYTSLAVIAAPLAHKPLAVECQGSVMEIALSMQEPKVMTTTDCSSKTRLYINKSGLVAHAPVPQNFEGLERGTILVNVPAGMSWKVHGANGTSYTVNKKADNLLEIEGVGREQVIIEGIDSSGSTKLLSEAVWMAYRGANGSNVTYKITR
jgi:hypothetical protein